MSDWNQPFTKLDAMAVLVAIIVGRIIAAVLW